MDRCFRAVLLLLASGILGGHSIFQGMQKTQHSNVGQQLAKIKSHLVSGDVDAIISICNPAVVVEHRTVAYRQRDDIQGNAIARIRKLNVPRAESSTEYLVRVETNQRSSYRESVRRALKAILEDGPVRADTVFVVSNGVGYAAKDIRGPLICGQIYSNVDFIITTEPSYPWGINRILIKSH